MRRLFILIMALLLPPVAQAQFDHGHAAFTALLNRHVVLVEGGKASQVRYSDLARDRAALKAYLDGLSRVTDGEFRGWTKGQQLAFLINAYNGFTLELILQRYPDLKSIRDFGYLPWNNVWKRRWINLLGRDQSLDGIEHEIIRAPGVYDDPRIHFAVNCASIGCPMLREEAFVADRLDAQLDEQVLRFLSDRSRNRVAADGALEVSRIFDWYKGDFSKGLRGIRSREQFFGRYARQLADDPQQQKAVAEGRAPLRFLDYDWVLNDVRR